MRSSCPRSLSTRCCQHMCYLWKTSGFDVILFFFLLSRDWFCCRRLFLVFLDSPLENERPDCIIIYQSIIIVILIKFNMFNFATKSTQFSPGKVLGGADVADYTSYRTLFCGKYKGPCLMHGVADYWTHIIHCENNDLWLIRPGPGWPRESPRP